MDRSKSYAFSRLANLSVTAYVQPHTFRAFQLRAKSHEYKYLSINAIKSYIYWLNVTKPLKTEYLSGTPQGAPGAPTTVSESRRGKVDEV
ncbi:MAG: hypothetical protein M3O31_07335 [Acidobacteriota bacterium]|nr:hypothetical protein [Acidobacteriota bacterium]